ncbi:MAG TPA: glycosyltransferase [Longimicrobiales bacterium]
MATPPPLLSVVIPTYNRLRLLRETIESVRAQTYAHWELIVVDDGSTDGTAEYVAGLGDPKIRLVGAERSGSPAVARNIGIGHARGEYVAFLDHDDIWMPGKLEAQVAALANRPEADWCYTRLWQIDPAGRSLGQYDDSVPFGGAALLDAIGLKPGITTSAVVVRRALLERMGGFDPYLTGCEDLDLWIRLRRESEPVAIIEPLTRIRVHDGSLSRDHLLMQRSCLRLYRKVAAGSSSRRVRRECRKLLIHRWHGPRAHRGGVPDRSLRALHRRVRPLTE